MYHLIKNKLYIQDGDKLVGVNIDTDQNVTHVKGTELKVKDVSDSTPLTHFEVQCKFGLIRGLEYNFPMGENEKSEPKVGVSDEPVGKAKATVKRTRK